MQVNAERLLCMASTHFTHFSCQAMADRLSPRRTSSRIRTVIETKEGQVGPRPESRLEKSIVSGSLPNRHLGKPMFLVQICHTCHACQGSVRWDPSIDYCNPRGGTFYARVVYCVPRTETE